MAQVKNWDQMNLCEQVGYNIKVAMKGRFTQEQLAARLYTDTRRVSDWLNGGALDFDRVEEIARVLDLDDPWVLLQPWYHATA